MMGCSVLIAAAGAGIALLFYVKKPELPAVLLPKLKGLYTFIHNKYYVDELYEAIIVKPIFRISKSILYGIGDVIIIEGIVNGVAGLMRDVGARLRPIQTGDTRVYARWIMGATILTIALVFWLAVV